MYQRKTGFGAEQYYVDGNFCLTASVYIKQRVTKQSKQ